MLCLACTCQKGVSRLQQQRTRSSAVRRVWVSSRGCTMQELAAKADVQYIAGGATQNSVRVAQWMLKDAGATSYIGCVGKDKYAEKMRAVCTQDGVNVQYMEDASTPTGTCAVCVLNKDRSLVANLAAANNYKVEHLQLSLIHI